MANKSIKLKSIELENFKNVKYGEVSFKEDKKNDKILNILGIYGQNGSGKTSIINALYLLKSIVSGEKIDFNFGNLIYYKSEFMTVKFEFRMIINNEKYKVFYEFKIRKKTHKEIDYEEIDLIEHNEGDKIEVFSEKLSYSKFEQNTWRKNITIVDYNIDYNDYIFRPIRNYKEVANSTEKKVNLGIAKGLAIENSTSFIFNKKTFILLLKCFTKTNSEASKIITIFRNFIIFNVFIIQNEELGSINSNKIIPISFMLDDKEIHKRGSIGLNLFNVSIIESSQLDIIERVLKQINIVLNILIPKLKIDIENYGREISKKNKEYFKIELLSVREDIKIPLKYESEGIKKIISILSVLIAMYNNENVFVAIDELDAGIFEYLLGEILEILSKSAKGQLIFTSHNLRALEKLNKNLVMFTTTNENNRYISLNNSKENLNFRDFYYRGIILGGQKEKLYNDTNKYEINFAFRKAWILGNE